MINLISFGSNHAGEVWCFVLPGELLGSDHESSYSHLGSASALGALEAGTFAECCCLGRFGSLCGVKKDRHGASDEIRDCP